jgi:hypothetical protein
MLLKKQKHILKVIRFQGKRLEVFKTSTKLKASFSKRFILY